MKDLLTSCMIFIVALLVVFATVCNIEYDVERTNPVYVVNTPCTNVEEKREYTYGDLELCIECEEVNNELKWVKFCCEEVEDEKF